MDDGIDDTLVSVDGDPRRCHAGNARTEPSRARAAPSTPTNSRTSQQPAQPVRAPLRPMRTKRQLPNQKPRKTWQPCNSAPQNALAMTLLKRCRLRMAFWWQVQNAWAPAGSVAATRTSTNAKYATSGHINRDTFTPADRPARALHQTSTPQDSDLYGRVRVKATGGPKCGDLEKPALRYYWTNEARSEKCEVPELCTEDGRLAPGQKSVTTLSTGLRS